LLNVGNNGLQLLPASRPKTLLQSEERIAGDAQQVSSGLKLSACQLATIQAAAAPEPGRSAHRGRRTAGEQQCGRHFADVGNNGLQLLPASWP
jgi:hypothetical protein